MEKLKNILKPNHSSTIATDEQVYGTSDPLNHPPGENDPQLHSSAEAKKDTGLVRQILNPGGDKYDETRFTQTASTEAPVDTVSGGNEEALQSGERAHKDTGLMRQILNPGGDKYDETRFTQTGATPSAAQDAGFQSQAGGASGLSSTYHDQSSQLRPTHPHDDGTSTASIKSGVTGAPQTGSEYTPSYQTGSGYQPAAQSNTSGQQGLAAGGATAAAASAVSGSGAPRSPTNKRLSGDHHEGVAIVQGTTTARKYSLSGHKRPENLGSSSPTTYATDAGRNTTTSSSSGSGHGAGSGAAALGAAGAAGALGAGALGGSRAQEQQRQPTTHQTSGEYDPFSTESAPAVTGAATALGGSSLRSSTGQESARQPATYQPTGTSHSSANPAALGAAGAAGALGAGTLRSQDSARQPATHQSTGTTSSSANPAAIAAARQAAGQPGTSSTSAGGYSDVSYRAPGPHETDTANRLDPNVDPTAYSAARAAPGAAARDEQPSHLGRDIGLAGAGAAAAGGAAYAAERGHDRSQGQGRFDNDSSAGVPQGNTGNTGTTGTTGTGTGIDTGPAPNTIGPHKSDALNVLDPRVQPQPELMKGNSSSQPQAERQDAREGERGYGREAAAAGGVGAAALGAGALASHEREKAPTSSTTGASSTAPLGSTSSTAPTGSTSSNAPFGATTSSADRPAAADRTRTGSYQDSGPLSDRRQDTGEKWRGWQNPYSTAAVDPRLDDMPGAFPETPGEQLDRAPEQQQRGSGLGAAAGAGALGAGAGAGAYEASKLGRVDETREPTGSAAVQNTPRTPERQQDVGMAMTTNEAVPSPTHREFTRGPEYGAVPRVEDDEIDRQHHYGRDALVAGGVGAAGVGTYEAAKHLEQSKEGPLSTKDIYGEEAVKPKPVQQQTAAGTQSASTSSSKPIFGEFETKTRDAAPLASTGQKPIYGDFAEKSATGAEDTGKDHHYGRDAAVAGGAGAAGLAGYEATKDHGKAPTSNREIYGDEAVKPKPVAGAEQTGKDHHYGRDAALAGGAGAAGLAGYEATKDHGKAPTSTREIYGDEAITPKPVAGAEQAGKEHHYGRDAALAGGAGAAGLAGYEATKDHSSKAPTSNREIYGQDAVTPKPVAGAEQTGKEHHYGRDAALAGGAGAAGVGAYEASKHAGSSRAPTSNREIYGEDAVKPRPVQQGATGASDANTSEHHYGRDAALAGGAGAAGAAGVGAYEASKHAGSSRAPTSNREIYGEDAVKPQPVQQGAPGAGPTGASATSATGQHHYGRDAALAGGAGAAGLGAYEASKHAGSSQPTLGQPTAGQAQQSSPAPHLRAAHNIYPPEVFQSHHQQPTSAATAGGLTGDSATGEAQRGQQQAQDHHYGRDAALAGSAAGLAGAGAYAATRDHPDQGYQTSSQNSKAYQHAPLQSTGQPAVGETQRGQQPPQEHHYGRDAALAGGATGLVGAGAYAATRDTPQQGYQTASENSKAFQHAPPLAQSQQSGQTAPFEQPRQAPPPPTQHHYGRDAGLAGGAAGGATAAGIGAHDYAQAPTAALRDPVAALQDAVSHGYDDQRAAPHMGGQQHFDPVRGGTLDEDGVSHPHKHAHPAYRPDQPQGQDHRDQDIAMTGAAGAGLTGAAFASQHGHHEGAAQEKFDPMNPTGTQHTGPFHKHKHTPSATSSKYSEENAPDSPSSGKRKHKILTFLNKKDDKDASPRSSLDKDHGNREVYSTRDPAAAERQQGFVGQEQYPPQQQQQALHGLGGPEGHEFGGLDQREGEGSALQGSTGSLGRGHSKLHKEPPKKWVQEHMGGQQGKVSDTPPRID